VHVLLVYSIPAPTAVRRQPDAGNNVFAVQHELRTHVTQSLTLPRPPQGISLRVWI
jgi:hypothetical protein